MSENELGKIYLPFIEIIDLESTAELTSELAVSQTTIV